MTAVAACSLTAAIALPLHAFLDVARMRSRFSAPRASFLATRGLDCNLLACTGPGESVLDAGADDYLTKPFGVGELLARVRVMLRRHARHGEAGPRHSFGDVEVDLSRHLVLRAEEEVHLTPQEYNRLALLVTNPGRVLARRFLMDKVWDRAIAKTAITCACMSVDFARDSKPIRRVPAISSPRRVSATGFIPESRSAHV